MPDPATDPTHDLVDTPQDDAPHPRIRLGTFLALLRILAGRRGHAAVRWHRHGFDYYVRVVRGPGGPSVTFDLDPTALSRDEARDRISAALDG